MRFSCYEWLTHDIDLSCVHCMLSIKVRSQCYISIAHAQHIINLFIDLTWHIRTLGRCTSVPTSLIYHGLKFINQNNVVHQLRYYLNSATVSNKQSKSTTNNLSRTWWGPSIIMSTDDTMDVWNDGFALILHSAVTLYWNQLHVLIQRCAPTPILSHCWSIVVH
jgi:hypothetical protein